MVLKVYLKILLIVLFYATVFLKVLFYLRNYFQKFYEASKFAYYDLCWKLFSSLESLAKFDERFKVTLVPFFYCRFQLMKLWIRHFTLEVLLLKCYIESFYITAKNNIRILWKLLVKNLSYFFSLLTLQ